MKQLLTLTNLFYYCSILYKKITKIFIMLKTCYCGNIYYSITMPKKI